MKKKKNEAKKCSSKENGNKPKKKAADKERRTVCIHEHKTNNKSSNIYIYYWMTIKRLKERDLRIQNAKRNLCNRDAFTFLKRTISKAQKIIYMFMFF